MWAGVSCRQNQQYVVDIFFGKNFNCPILFIHSAWQDSQPKSWFSINTLRTKTSPWQNGSISVERAWSHGMCTLTQTWWFKPDYVVCVCAHRRQLRVFINALLRVLRLQNLADHQVINERTTQNLGKKCGLDWPRKRRDCTDYNLVTERFWQRLAGRSQSPLWVPGPSTPHFLPRFCALLSLITWGSAQ